MRVVNMRWGACCSAAFSVLRAPLDHASLRKTLHATLAVNIGGQCGVQARGTAARGGQRTCDGLSMLRLVRVVLAPWGGHDGHAANHMPRERARVSSELDRTGAEEEGGAWVHAPSVDSLSIASVSRSNL